MRRRRVLERTVDYPAKMICLQLVNIHRDRELYPEPLELEDVFPSEPEGEETIEEAQERILQQFRRLTATFGGTDLTQ